MSELTAGTRKLVPGFILRRYMRGLKIYEVNPRYIKYLSGFQEHLFYSDGEKA